MYNCIKIEQTAGYYECSKCNHKYIPTYSNVLWAMHMNRTRYMKCPKCNEKVRVFGNENSKNQIEKSGVPVIAELPIDPHIAKLVDNVEIEEYETDAFDNLIKLLEEGK